MLLRKPFFLPDEIVTSTTTKVFKKSLDDFLKAKSSKAATARHLLLTHSARANCSSCTSNTTTKTEVFV